MKLIRMTSGPILELGCGNFSTPFLHWTCFPTKRRLVTYESDPRYYKVFLAHIAGDKRNLQSDFHEVHLVSNWDDADLSKPWSIAFVDHAPGGRRMIEVQRLLHAEYVVAHDTEICRTLWKKAFVRYPYQYTYRASRPWTTVLSRTHNLEGFTIP
jgi:hypothetical protein